MTEIQQQKIAVLERIRTELGPGPDRDTLLLISEQLQMTYELVRLINQWSKEPSNRFWTLMIAPILEQLQ